MSDKPNTPQPDRAGDDLDVPNYTPGKNPSPTTDGTAEASGGSSLYDRIGRAAPQSIPAQSKQRGTSDSAETTSFAAASGSGAGSSAVGSTAGGSGTDDRSEALRSDAPTTSFSRASRPEQPAEQTSHPPRQSAYRDTDFAPTTSGATVQSSSQPTPEPSTQHFTRTEPPVEQPTAGGLNTGGPATITAADTTGATAETEKRDKSREGKRGTIDWGILMIRVLLGAYLVLTSVATFFQLGGSAGLAGLESEYADYVIPDILAILVPSLQLAAGVFLIFGLITPLFAALATVVTSFTALHALSESGAGLNVFAWDDSVMLSVILLVISLALQFTGPGLYSLDVGRGWARRPLVSSWIFVILGIAGAVALWWFGAGVNPIN